MAIKRGRTPSAGLEAIALFAQFDIQIGSSSVTDLARRREVIGRLSAGLDESLLSESRLHGVRVQNMFEAVAVTLGDFVLFKTEDSGNYYFEEGAGELSLPDFRVITSSGEQLLIEVKNVAPQNPTSTTIPARQLVAQRAYASLTSSRLMVAHYWSRFNIWTLTDSSRMSGEGKYLTLSLQDAIMANEMSQMGDGLVGTQAPLSMSIQADPTKERRGRNDTAGDEFEVGFTIGSVNYYSRGRLIEDETERKLAHFMLLYGTWQAQESVDFDSDGRPSSMRFDAAPDEEYDTMASQGFSFVGTLSSMYSTYFNVRTLDQDRQITGLNEIPTPDFLANLLPADYWDTTDRVLPIWRITQTLADQQE